MNDRYNKMKNLTFEEMVEFFVKHISCDVCPQNHSVCKSSKEECENHMRFYLYSDGEVL